MSQELFYTSAPRGLKPGARGFCTVATTRGMSAALMEKLESLSGYRPLFPPLDAKAALNPVVCSHLRINVGGKAFSLLSRICSAGLDYTERSNNFAHHVVLDPTELPPAGPAWLLAQPGFMESRWQGEPRLLSAGRVPPRGNVGPAVCRAWEELTGDPGWAGVVAEAIQHDPSRLAYLLFEPGMDLLPLIAEALALLPPEQRWHVTFSTYYTGLPQGISCLWRGVPHDSVEAKSARQVPTALILSLGTRLGHARGGSLVALARGERLPPPTVPAPAWPTEAADGDREEVLQMEKAGRSARPQPAYEPDYQDLQPAAAATAPALRVAGEPPAHAAPPPPPPNSSGRRSRTGKAWSGPWLLGMIPGTVAGMLLTFGAVGVGLRTGVLKLADNETAREVTPEREPRDQARPAPVGQPNDSAKVVTVGFTQGEVERRVKEREQTVKEEERKRHFRDAVQAAEKASAEKASPEKAKALVEYVKGLAKLEDEQKDVDKLEKRLPKLEDPKPPAPQPKPAPAGKDLAKQLEDLQKEFGKPDKLSKEQRAQLAKRLDELEKDVYSPVAKLDAVRKEYAPRLVRDYFKLPGGINGTEVDVTLPKGLTDPQEGDHWTLQLRGLKDRGLKQKFENETLKITQVVGSDENARDRPLAFFKKEGRHIKFKWEDTDGKGEAARQAVRSSVLEIQAKSTFHVGLMRVEADPKAPFPVRFDFAKDGTASRRLERNKEDRLESALFLASAQCEIGDQTRVLRALEDTARLEWPGLVTLRLGEKGDGGYQLTAHWLGDDEDRKRLIVRSLVAYVKVDNLLVEVWRLREKP
jgi:hypothetical protein